MPHFEKMWFDGADMGIYLLSAGHMSRGLDEVAAASVRAPELLAKCRQKGNLTGAVLLATCNRVEVLIEAENPPLDLLTAFPGAPILSGVDAASHLFRVACGLDSMVVGEREIVGQVRRATEVARQEGTLTPALSKLIQSALAVSKKVATATALTGRGRSIVEVGLGIAEETLGDLNGARVVLVGTGSYAGASVAALRDRGVRDIAVHSQSGRAQAFSRGHGTRPIDPDGLDEALTAADLLVSCRGTGQPVLHSRQLQVLAQRRATSTPAHDDFSSAANTVESAHSRRPLVVLDLALRPDIAPGESVPHGVVRIDLDTIAQRLPSADADHVSAAQRLVDEAVTAYARERQGRGVDAAVVELRKKTREMLDEEIARLSGLEVAERERTADALTHFAARLLDVPCRRARQAVGDGNATGYLEGLQVVLGVGQGVKP